MSKLLDITTNCDEPERNTPSVGLERASWFARGRDFLGRHLGVAGTVGASFGVFGIFAIQGILMARLLGPEKRGEYGTVVLYTQALMYIGLLGTLLSIAAFAARYPDRLANLRRAVIKLGSMTGFVTMLVVMILALFALPSDKQYLAPLCIVCSFMLPFDHVRLGLLAVDQGAGAFGKYNLNLLINAAILPLMLCVLWGAGSSSLPLVAAATLLVPFLSLAYRFVTDGRNSIGEIAEPSPKDLMLDGIPYAAAQTSSNLFYRLDGLLMLWFASLTVQGYYTAAVSTAGMMVVAPNALSLFTFRASAISEKQATVRGTIVAGLGVAALQAVVLAAFLVVLSPLIVLVFGASFRGAIPFARLLLPAHAIGGFTYVAGGYLRGRRKPMVEVWSRVLGTVVMIGVFVALNSTWHELSVPIAAICAHTTCALILCWAVLSDVRRTALESQDNLEVLAA